MAAIKVLVVDDEPAIRDLIVAVLEDEGYEARGVGSGSRALDLMKTDRPSLVLMDIMMPDMDGREALRRIRLHPEFQEIPVVMMSAAYAADHLDEDGTPFLPKPFDLEHLLRTVAEVVGPTS